MKEHMSSADLRPQADRSDVEIKMANAIDAADASVFIVESQTSQNDKVSFLRLQKLIRSRLDNYVYAEVGSHLGGTLLPHLGDRHCRMAISIDPRPLEHPDAFGRSFVYNGNSTARMLEVLRSALPEACLAKLTTFDLDAAQVPRAEIKARADLVMIDGEHTVVAAFSDVMSLLPVVSENAVLSFHDANLVADAIRNLERFFAYAGVKFATVFLPDNVCAIGLRGMADPVAAELGPHALDRDRFLANARKQVLQDIALNYMKDFTSWKLVSPLWRLETHGQRKARRRAAASNAPK
jgi:Methyltransferase domain